MFENYEWVGEFRSDWGSCPWVAGPLQQIEVPAWMKMPPTLQMFVPKWKQMASILNWISPGSVFSSDVIESYTKLLGEAGTIYLHPVNTRWHYHETVHGQEDAAKRKQSSFEPLLSKCFFKQINWPIRTCYCHFIVSHSFCGDFFHWYIPFFGVNFCWYRISTQHQQDQQDATFPSILCGICLQVTPSRHVERVVFQLNWKKVVIFVYVFPFKKYTCWN